MHTILTLLFINVTFLLHAVSVENFENPFIQDGMFSYPLEVSFVPAKEPTDEVIVCCHGYGSNGKRLVNKISSANVPAHLLGFNFPDHDITIFDDHSHVTYGTIEELLPALYILKRLTVDWHIDKIALYGFSAGGGAVVNIIAVLHSSSHDDQLAAIGIWKAEKKTILDALKRGAILLDAPLKSVEEVAQANPLISPDHVLIKNYQEHDLRPIDSLRKWQGLSLKVFLFFQNPDRILSNRDDQDFIDRLLSVNAEGENKIIIADEGGHGTVHMSLWEAYKASSVLDSKHWAPYNSLLEPVF